MRTTACRGLVRFGSLVLLLLAAGCSTVRGLGQDLQEGSSAVQAAIWGDDPDAPPND